jgi:two-component system, NarL family, invasion response regulator UvrY
MRVLILDDHPLLRRAIGQVIHASFPSAVVREASTGEEALHIVGSERVGLAILDIMLPDQDGVTVLRKIKQLQPQTRCLMLTIRDDPWYVRLSMRHGASGYLMKGSAVDDLRKAIQTVMMGDRYVSEALASALDDARPQKPSLGERPSLSAREHEVLVLLAKGRTVSQASKQLKLSVKTVSTYRVRLLDKLGLQTTADLIRYAVDHGLVQ